MKRIIKKTYRIGGGIAIFLAVSLVIFRFIIHSIPFERFIPSSIAYDKVSVVWQGWEPGLKLSQVEIKDLFEAKARHIVLIADWPASLFHKEWRLKSIKLIRLTANLPLDGAETRLLDLAVWHQIQQTLKAHWQRCPVVIVRDAEFDFLKQLRLILSFGDELKIRGAGQITKGEPLEFNFGIALKDWQSPKGEIDGLLYLNLFGLSLKKAIPFLPAIGLPEIKEGKTSFEAWAFVKDNEPTRGAIVFEGFNVQLQDDKTLKVLDYLNGTLGFLKWTNHLDVWGKNFHFVKTELERHDISESTPTAFSFKISPEKIEFIAEALQLSDWRPFLSPLLFLPKPLKTVLKEYDPEGLLGFLQVEVTPDYQPLVVRGKVEKLSIKPVTFPGFDGLAGVFVYKDKIGRFDVYGKHLSLNGPTLFEKPIKIKHPRARVWWEESKGDIGRMIWIEALEGKVKKSPFLARGKFEMGADPVLHLNAGLSDLSIRHVLQLLPRKIMDKTLTQWLESSLDQGYFKDIQLNFEGHLKQFPFVNNEGVFKVVGKLKEASLNYVPQWPILTDLQGDLIFDRHTFQMSVEKGQVIGSPMTATAWIPDLTAKINALTIQADVNSTLEKGWEVVQGSPIQHTVGQTLSHFDLAGPMQLSLKLDVPITVLNEPKTKVKGILIVKDGQFSVRDWKLDIDKLNGEFKFTEDELLAENIQGFLFGVPTLFHVKSDVTPPYPQIRVDAKGEVEASALAKWLNISTSAVVTGKTAYNANLLFTSEGGQQEGQVTVDTDLKGMTVNLPEPFNKTADEALPSQFKLYIEPNDRFRVGAKYGDRLSAALSFREEQQKWVPLGAHLYFGVQEIAKYRDDGVLRLEGILAKFDVLAITKDKTLFGDLEPRLNLEISLLKLGEYDFEHVGIQGRYNTDKKQWLYRFSGDMLSGIAVVPLDTLQPIALDLDRLLLISHPVLQKDAFEIESKRALNLRAKEIRYNGKWVTDLTLELEPQERGYHIKQLVGSSYQTQFKAAGSWEGKHVFLNGNLASRNFSRFFDNWGYASTLKDARGKFSFNLDWLKAETGIDLSSLNGTLEIDLSKGYIHGVDPGLGRILSLISVDSIQKRLLLDFTDLSKDGLSFDKLAGHFDISAGRVYTKDLYLDGSTARVEFNGQVMLPTKKIDASVGVMPNVTGGLPIAVAIAAGNPAIGAAVWVVDKLIGRQLKEITRYQYQVSGTWVNPAVTEPLGKTKRNT